MTGLTGNMVDKVLNNLDKVAAKKKIRRRKNSLRY